jgi:hypothetical protein
MSRNPKACATFIFFPGMEGEIRASFWTFLKFARKKSLSQVPAGQRSTWRGTSPRHVIHALCLSLSPLTFRDTEKKSPGKPDGTCRRRLQRSAGGGSSGRSLSGGFLDLALSLPWSRRPQRCPPPRVRWRRRWRSWSGTPLPSPTATPPSSPPSASPSPTCVLSLLPINVGRAVEHSPALLVLLLLFTDWWILLAAMRGNKQRSPPRRQRTYSAWETSSAASRNLVRLLMDLLYRLECLSVIKNTGENFLSRRDW